MSEEIVQNKPLAKYISMLFSLFILYPIGFYLILPWYGTMNWPFLIIDFIVIPLFLIFSSFFIGWIMKKNAIDYKRPKWDFKTKSFSLDEIKTSLKGSTNGNSRVEAKPHFWFFFTPIVVSLFLLSIALYSMLVSWFPLDFLLFVLVTSYLLLHSFSFWSAWRATSNNATDDFIKLLITENLQLAKTQSRLPGVSDIKLLIETADEKGYSVFRNPRVLFRVNGLEKSSYVESRTDELGSIIRLRAGLLDNQNRPLVEWFWHSRDRFFRKENRLNNDSYYVENPVPMTASELGVKDVHLVTMNAIALVILEYGKIHEDWTYGTEILEKMGIAQAIP